MDCHYCGWSGGKHDPACPAECPPDVSQRRRAYWEIGKADGRTGKPCAFDNPSYRLGYNQGVIALEESGNGFNPTHEGRQW